MTETADSRLVANTGYVHAKLVASLGRARTNETLLRETGLILREYLAPLFLAHVVNCRNEPREHRRFVLILERMATYLVLTAEASDRGDDYARHVAAGRLNWWEGRYLRFMFRDRVAGGIEV